MATITRSGDVVKLKCSFFEKDLAKEIPHWEWRKQQKLWTYPMGIGTLYYLKKYFPKAEGLLELEDDLRPAVPLFTDNHKIPLYQHQKLCVEFALQRTRTALLSDIGTGKTGIAITYLDTLIQNNAIQKALIVCPLSMVGVWEEEFQKFSDLIPVALNGRSSKQRIQRMQDSLADQVIYIVNYEFVRNCLKQLMNIPFDCIIADESSKIKTYNAQVSKALWRLASPCKYKMILNAVLTPNNPLEAFAQYRFLDSSIFGDSWHRFRYKYAEYGGFQGHEVTGYKELEDFKKRIFSVGIRFLLKDCVDIPDKIFQKRVIPLPPENQKAYDGMKEDMVTFLKDTNVTAANVLVKIQKLQQITSGFIRDEEGKDIPFKTNPKMDTLFEIFEQAPEGEKFVVFYQHIYPLLETERRAKEKGWKVVTLYGATKNRADVIREFQNGPAKLFLTQIRTGGLGVTLTASAHAIFYENDFSPGVRDQAEGRLHRVGQERKVTYTDLLVKDSIDGRVLQILKKKMSVIEFIQKESAAALLK